MNKQLATINFLKNEGMNTEALNIIKSTDRISSQITSNGFDVTIQSENYDMIKELYEEQQEKDSYSYVIKVINQEEELKMEFNKSELKVLAEMVSESILGEAKVYGEDTCIYKETENYKTKAKLYERLMSEYAGFEQTINEDSIFGMLDIS